MKKEMRDKIIAYNRLVVEKSEKAGDLETLINAFMGLPYGQLQHILSDPVIAVLQKHEINTTEVSK